MARGMYNMHCFNGLSAEQQARIVEWGNLPIFYKPEGWCQSGAEVEITTVWDRFPGPRYYCRRCAIEFVASLPTTPPPSYGDHVSEGSYQ